MATVRLPGLDTGDVHIPDERELISYEEALASLSQDEAGRATLYAMNTLLIQRGVYTSEEFQFQFRQSAQKQIRKRKGR